MSVIPFPIIARPVPKIVIDDPMAVVRAGWDMRVAMAKFAKAAIQCAEVEHGIQTIEAEAQDMVQFLVKASHGTPPDSTTR